jgi:hypothetical protein
MSKDMQDGSKTVKIAGQAVMLKNKSFYKTSPLGNEAATRSFGGSVVTHTITGKTYFAAWSMDVKVEGYNVDRHLDLTGSNHASDPSSPPPVQPGQEESASGDDNCSKCGKPNTPPGAQKPAEVKRVCGTDRNGAPLPKYQLRQGENGLSAFAGTITDGQILSEFRSGSTVDTKTVAEIEGKGLTVVPTHGDCDHLKTDELQDNHWEIQPGPGMDRNAFKKVLKTL